ncbi:MULTISPECIES: hypothetical protein [unclassified Streptomyces]|uniref:hypothetical protein n=1 Tax=unclassified Streptomyces TaxID=2593676 RepID=UPI0033A26CC0
MSLAGHVLKIVTRHSPEAGADEALWCLPAACGVVCSKVTRNSGSPAAVLAMVFKLVESAQVRRRAVTGVHLVPLVRAGARFESGVLVEREQDTAA